MMIMTPSFITDEIVLILLEYFVILIIYLRPFLRHLRILQFLNHQANMPVSLSNLTQLLVFKLKSTASRHKKKLILLIVVVVVGYVAKKKLTLAHLLSFVELVTKFVQSLPLPQAPKLRTLAEFEHPPTVPLKALLEATQLEDLKKRISQKEAGWEDLKQAILTCAALTLTLYNPHSLYFLIQNKYRQQFLTLNASIQFQQSMYELRKRFVQDVPLIFQNTRQALSEELFRIELKKEYNLEELDQIFEKLTLKILEAKFDLSKDEKYTVMNRCSPQTKNYFTSVYEYMPEKKSVLSAVGSILVKLLGGAFHLGEELLPTPTIEVTSERFMIAKAVYSQSLKKASSYLLIEAHQNPIEWPCQTSKELFELVLEELQFILTSLNFSILLKAASKYNLKVLSNRLRLLFSFKQKTHFKLTELLPLLNKILQEEFYKPNLMEHRDRYHNSEVKKALKVAAQEVGVEIEGEGKTMEEFILEEIELKQSFQFLEKELELKLFNERSGVVMRPKNSGGGEHEAEEIKKLLGMMGSSDVLNDQG